MKAAEDEAARTRTGENTGFDESRNDTVAMNKLDVDYRALDEVEPLQSLVNDPSSNMFVTGEADESAVTPGSFAGRS